MKMTQAEKEYFIQIGISAAPVADEADMIYGLTNKGRVFRRYMVGGEKWKLIESPEFKVTK